MARGEPRPRAMLLGGDAPRQVPRVAGDTLHRGVEEALCFGWIDSTLKRLPDGRLAQRLSPRRPRSHWTELNMERCRSLEERGLMTEAGRRALAVGQEMAEKNKLE